MALASTTMLAQGVFIQNMTDIVSLKRVLARSSNSDQDL
jgi:hypothetical protein